MLVLVLRLAQAFVVEGLVLVLVLVLGPLVRVLVRLGQHIAVDMV